MKYGNLQLVILKKKKTQTWKGFISIKEIKRFGGKPEKMKKQWKNKITI